MSTVQPQTISVIAESVAVARLGDDAAKALAPHVDVRLREVVQVWRWSFKRAQQSSNGFERALALKCQCDAPRMRRSSCGMPSAAR